MEVLQKFLRQFPCGVLPEAILPEIHRKNYVRILRILIPEFIREFPPEFGNPPGAHSKAFAEILLENLSRNLFRSSPGKLFMCYFFSWSSSEYFSLKSFGNFFQFYCRNFLSERTLRFSTGIYLFYFFAQCVCFIKFQKFAVNIFKIFLNQVPALNFKLYPAKKFSEIYFYLRSKPGNVFRYLKTKP